MPSGEESLRQAKVGRQIQRDLSQIFQQHPSDFSARRMVTVTRVRMSSDMEYATAFLSIFPSEGVREVLEEIRRQTGEIRYTLGRRVRQMRVVPQLRFELDDSLDYIARIDELLAPDHA